jgi:O-antigen/teichoic acid export membrane protein
MAMISIVLALGMAYADLGLSGAIVHRRDTTRAQLSTLYWTNVAAGAAVTLVVLAARPLVAALLGEPRLAGLLTWVAPVFLVAALGQPYQATLQKELRFRALALVDVVAAASGAIVAIAAATMRLGVLSLALGHLAAVAARTLLVLAVGMRGWRPGRHWSASDLAGYLSFGVYQLGERTVGAFMANADNLVIGSMLGAAALGPYALAYQLVVVPLTKINPIVSRVALPLFARHQDDGALLRRGYVALSKALLVAAGPMLVGAAATAHVLVPVVFGDGWAAAVPMVRILALVGLLKCLGNPIGSLLLATGRADIGFRWNATTAGINVVAFVLAARGGVHAVAWTYLALSLTYAVVFQAAIGPRLHIGAAEYWRSLVAPSLAAAGMGGAVLAARPLLASADARLELVLLVALGAAVYLPLLLALDRPFVRELRETLAPGA